MKKNIILILFMLTISNVAFSKEQPSIFSHLQSNKNKAIVQTVCMKLKIIKSVLDLYKLDKFKYPSTEEGLKILVENKKIKEKHLIDHWGTPYVYTNNDELSLISLGADTKKGGEGINADISLAACQQD